MKDGKVTLPNIIFNYFYFSEDQFVLQLLNQHPFYFFIYYLLLKYAYQKKIYIYILIIIFRYFNNKI